MKDLQKASMWKRISAAVFDLILLAVIAVGMALLVSWVVNYDHYYDRQNQHIKRIEEKYGTDLSMTDEEYAKLSDEKKAIYDEAKKDYETDPEVDKTFRMLVSLSLIIVTFGLLIAFVLWELVIPLLLKNGQTLGKKLFGLAIMREDAVRATPFQIAVRAILGKFTVEVMFPVYIIIMFFSGALGIVGPVVLLALLIVQIVLLIRTPGCTPIHDLFARTIVVDFASQRVFDTVEERESYYRRLHEEMTQDD